VERDAFVDRFLNGVRDMFLYVDGLADIFGQMDSVVMLQYIRDDIGKEKREGRAIITQGHIGNEGSYKFGRPVFMDAYQRSEKKGLVWYHFEIFGQYFKGISKHVPGYRGDILEIPEPK